MGNSLRVAVFGFEVQNGDELVAVVEVVASVFGCRPQSHGQALEGFRYLNGPPLEVDRAVELHFSQVIVRRVVEDVRSFAVTMAKFADILKLRGDLDGALQICRDQLPIFERLGDTRERAVTKGTIAGICQSRGDFDGALAVHAEQLSVFERLGDRRERAAALYKIAGTLLAADGLEMGRAQEIADALRESFAIFVELDVVESVGAVGSAYAQVLAMAGHRDEALEVLDRAEAAFAKLQDQSGLDQVRELRDMIRQLPARDEPPAGGAPA